MNYVHGIPVDESCPECYGMLADEGREGSGLRYVQGTADLDHADQLDHIEQRCLQAVLAGGTTWTRFKADAERETGLPWMEIKQLLDERYADRAAA